MRRALFAAVAAAPLCALAAAGAQAETVISTARNTPVSTATANSGAPDDVRISSAGSVALTAGTAVTLDSNNTVINEGPIQVPNASGAIGILVEGGRTGSVSNRGQINILEDFTPTDTDNDGDLDGPFAQGSGRYGVRVTGALPFVGSITQTAAGRINVEGVDSFGVSVEAGLNGDLALGGAVSIVGDRSRAVSVSGPVTGSVSVAGVTAQGQGAIGLDVAAPVGGRVTVSGAVAATGYRVTVRPADPSRLDADDLLQGGPAVRIAGSVAGGVVVDAAVTNRSATNPDLDGDGVDDTLQTTGQIDSFGSGPGLLLTGAGQDIDIGPLVAGQAGLQIKGGVRVNGLFDGVDATAVQVGAGTGAVRISNGVRVSGTVEAVAAQETATGLHFGAGGEAPLLATGGIIRAGVTGSSGSARAVRIDAGASAPTLRNTGILEAAAGSAGVDALAIDDRSGTLTLIENSSIIRAVRNVAAGTAVTGRSIAFDLSANTTGAVVRQFGVADGDDGADGVADPDADGDGVDDADEPFIIGDGLFGSGADRLELLNGTMVGAVSFGAGADVLLIDGGARLVGAVSDSDGLLAVDLRRGVLELGNTQPLQISSLDVGADGGLIVTLNPASTAPR